MILCFALQWRVRRCTRVGEGGKLRGKKDIININRCAYMKVGNGEKFSNRMRDERGSGNVMLMT